MQNSKPPRTKLSDGVLFGQSRWCSSSPVPGDGKGVAVDSFVVSQNEAGTKHFSRCNAGQK